MEHRRCRTCVLRLAQQLQHSPSSSPGRLWRKIEPICSVFVLHHAWSSRAEILSGTGRPTMPVCEQEIASCRSLHPTLAFRSLRGCQQVARETPSPLPPTSLLAMGQRENGMPNRSRRMPSPSRSKPKIVSFIVMQDRPGCGWIAT